LLLPKFGKHEEGDCFIKFGKPEKMSIVFGHIGQSGYVIGENIRHRFPAHIRQNMLHTINNGKAINYQPEIYTLFPPIPGIKQ
jgi:hypothetical protein